MIYLMSQKGFIPIFVILIGLVTVGGGVVAVETRTHFLSKAFSPGTETVKESTSSASLTESLEYALPSPKASKHKSAVEYLKERFLRKPSPTPTPPVKTPIPKASSSVNPKNVSIPTSQPTTAAAVAGKKPTCSINVLSSDQGANVSRLIYAYEANGGSRYMIAAQWDFDGDGSWDTDMSSGNGEVTHTFSPGGHTIKLKVKGSDEIVTDVCSKYVNIPNLISVSFTGQVFSDNNCNDVWDPNEQGLSGITVRFDKQDIAFYRTVTTDPKGNYNLTESIPENDSLTLKPVVDLNNGRDPSIVTYSPYKIHYMAPYATLNSSYRSINKDLPLVPSENISNCF